ncbi:hypothetical protein Tco_0373432 [Tanacetum coccineum]
MENEPELSYETLTRVYLGSYEHYKGVVSGESNLRGQGSLMTKLGNMGGDVGKIWDEVRICLAMQGLEGCWRGLDGSRSLLARWHQRIGDEKVILSQRKTHMVALQECYVEVVLGVLVAAAKVSQQGSDVANLATMECVILACKLLWEVRRTCIKGLQQYLVYGSAISNSAVDVEDLIQDAVIDTKEMIQDNVVNAEEQTQDDAAPFQDSWFNELVDAEKDPKDFFIYLSGVASCDKYACYALENQLLSVSLLICLGKHDCVEKIPSGDENPIRTLGDYSKPSHEGYRNTTELPVGNNVLRDRNAKESWALLEDLALYDNESWNDLRDFAKLVKAIALPQDVPSTSDRRLIELKYQVQRLMESHLAPMQPTQVNKMKQEVSGLVSNFMASQDTRLSKFEANFKQLQSEMTNKIDIVVKAIIDRIAGALPSDTVKNPKLSASPVLSALFLMLFGVTAALIDVNAAQSKLVLLENFNEKYSKCLRLMVKLQLPVHKDMDQDSAHMVAASKVPMLKLENGATFPKTTVVEGVEKVMSITSAEDRAQRRLEVKARSTLMIGIPNKCQLKFNSIKDTKLLLEAVEKRFGGNAATKKTQRNLLKYQYENCTAPSLEMLDQIFDRLQKLVSQLELLDEKLSQEDVNQKLLRSLSPESNTHAIVW